MSTRPQERPGAQNPSQGKGGKGVALLLPLPLHPDKHQGIPKGRKGRGHTLEGGKLQSEACFGSWLLTCREGEDGRVLDCHHGEELLDEARGLGRGVGGRGFLAAAAAAVVAHGAVIGLHGMVWRGEEAKWLVLVRLRRREANGG